MRWLKPLSSAGETLIDRILCVLGAVLASQGPEFMQQYLQRLGGRLDEARRHFVQFQEIARQAGKTVPELATQYSASIDPAVASMGKLVNDTEARVNTLAAAETALREASLWERPCVFLRHLDAEIASGTANVFKPAVPTTIEGALYALVGIIAILAVYHGLLAPLARRICGGTCAKKATAKIA